MSILVTGATGKVGRQVVTQLAARGVPVRALVRAATARLPPSAEVAVGDLTDVDSVRAAAEGTTAGFLVWPFFHAEGLREVLEVLPRRIVYLSAEGAPPWAAGAE